ncbi:2-hydroxyacid dehydrogenase [Afipia sp. P52-10]|jgi:lactate dehydrogenase-like 2-hydroxyacid dehydrogenase|uniref:2-hydroxyacid dehydrogenase n=1 Tax=Afipia sp. P52-10 TaxID=1429916 RepID=UPI0003DEFFA8|nr:2-hydroxyacid dehydrogenase [Afipia sp. P52-10]ETR75588.1 2-hydroxyacid dehydrogenase [Afipia sp. P52-10]
MLKGVLTYPRFPKRLQAMIADRYELLDPGKQTPGEAFSAEQRAKVVALVTIGGRPVTGAFMDELPNLKLIACYGTGYDGVDRAAAKARGIAVCNSPGANAAAVADQAIALMLAVMRDVPRADAYVRSGAWGAGERSNIHAAFGLKGRKIGVYGMGAIGQKIASRAASFEADVQYFSRRKLEDVAYPHHATLESLADWCDVLQIAVRAGDDNRHIINADILRRLGPHGYVINISRGLVIDEPALIEALQHRAIAGAGLDVFENEPRIRPEFLTLPNVVLSPHQAGHTIEAHEDMQDRVMANLDAFFAGKPVPFEVPLD